MVASLTESKALALLQAGDLGEVVLNLVDEPQEIDGLSATDSQECSDEQIQIPQSLLRPTIHLLSWNGSTMDFQGRILWCVE